MKQQSATASLALVFLILFVLACTCGDLGKERSRTDRDAANSDTPVANTSGNRRTNKKTGKDANTENTDDDASSDTAASADIKEIYLARDDGDGSAGDRVTSFNASDNPIHCVVLFDSSKPGTVVKMNLVAVNAEKVKKNTDVVDTSITLQGKQDKADFQASLPQNWPVGTYRFDIFVNDEKAGSQTFEIE
jgi:hypothetical protein